MLVGRMFCLGLVGKGGGQHQPGSDTGHKVEGGDKEEKEENTTKIWLKAFKNDLIHALIHDLIYVTFERKENRWDASFTSQSMHCIYFVSALTVILGLNWTV